jgi:hypothetical protein
MGIFSSAEEKMRRRQEKQEIQEKVQKMFVSTAGVNENYSVVGIIRAESLPALKELALKKGANALIGVGFFGYDEQCYGTAVTLTEDTPEPAMEEHPVTSKDEI